MIANKQRPRVRPMGALAAAAAKKQQPAPTTDAGTNADTEPGTSNAVMETSIRKDSATSSTAIPSEPEKTQAVSTSLANDSLNSTMHTIITSTTSTKMQSTQRTATSVTQAIVRRTTPAVIRPGAASTLPQQMNGTTAQIQMDPFALAFRHLDDTMHSSPALPPSTADTSTTSNIIFGAMVPYQHMGMLDPSWNIPPPNTQEKTLKDFCSKFKLPRQKKSSVVTGTVRNEGRISRTRRNDHSNRINLDNPALEDGEQDAKNYDHQEQQNDDDDNAQRSGPLVEVINGEIVIKQSSLILGARRPTTQEVDRELDENIVVEESTGITATYNSFTKRQKTQHWSAHDTKRFFSALRQCGTDFTTMETLFNANGDEEQVQYRTRKQLKNKYLIESRKHPQLIDLAMNPNVQLPVDLSAFGELDIGTVVPPFEITASSVTQTTDPTSNIQIDDEENTHHLPLNQQQSDDILVDAAQKDEQSGTDRNESRPLEEEVTTMPPTLIIPPVVRTTVVSVNKNRFRSGLKGKKSFANKKKD